MIKIFFFSGSDLSNFSYSTRWGCSPREHLSLKVNLLLFCLYTTGKTNKKIELRWHLGERPYSELLKLLRSDPKFCY